MDETFTKISERGPSHLFNDCVDLFNCIRFDQFHELCYKELPLKLAIIQCRLARWGARADGEKPFEEYLEDNQLKMMQEILRGMVAAFQACYKRSCRELTIINDDQQRDDESMPVDTATKRVREKLQTITKERLPGVDLIDKTPWTIYNKGHAELLILDCVAYIAELEGYIEFNRQRLENLARMEISEFGGVTALRWLRDASRDVDDLMEIVASEKYDEYSRNDAAIRIDYGSHRIPPRYQSGNNYVGSIESSSGYINIGNTYGGKGFWG